MKWSQTSAEVFVPDGVSAVEALKRTTHLGIGAHPDDLEFMAWKPILDCRGRSDAWFTGVMITDGGGFARDRESATLSTEEVCRLRRKEQQDAAKRGEYSAVVHLAHQSSDVKRPGYSNLSLDLQEVFRHASPEKVFTHNPADKHETHVALCVAVVNAIRRLPIEQRPKAFYGCEVWRGLDWMQDEDKVVFDVSGHEDFMRSLMSVYSSQIRGKHYDEATLGRKRANATYFASHETDRCSAMEYAMDLTPLVRDSRLNLSDYVSAFVRRFESDVTSRIARHTPS